MAHQGGLQVHRTDPFTPGLDDVLGAVGQGDVGQLVQVPDITGAQPTVVEPLRVSVLVVATGDPRTPDLEQMCIRDSDSRDG